MEKFFTDLFGGNNGLASNYGGVGTYATFTGTDGSKIGLNKDAYDAAIQILFINRLLSVSHSHRTLSLF